jgi:predicted nucleic acid-binding Zn ribbon protein
VVDTTAPSFGVIPANVTVECSSIPAPAMVTATDVCSEVEVTVNDVAMPVVDCQYQIIRTWTATDVCGNFATASQTITVIDTTAPVISGQDSEMTLECNVQPSIIAPTVEDNCDENVELVFSSQDFPGVCENSYTTVYTWTATDDCGNTSVRTLTFHFQDTTEPTFDTMLSNMTVECDMVPAAAVVTASDNCDDNVAVTMEESMTEGCNYVITRTYTAVDNCGNTSVMVQTINVVDTTAPVLSGVPANATIECGSQLPIAFVTAEDNCDETLQVSMNTQTVDGECSSQVIRTWSVTDDCGNTATATQVITIVDTTAPYIVSSPVAEVTVECGNPLPTDAPVFGDVCDDELTILAISGENNITDCGYDVEKVWTAVDNCGNSYSFTQVIHVVDTTAPSFGVIPANVTVECSSIPAPAMVTATDVCSEVEVTVNDVALPVVDCQYQIIRTWTATDVCGNFATASQTITVIDTTAPVISGQDSEMTLECNVQPSVIAPTVEDNCDENVELVFSSQDFPGVCENSYTTVYTWTATDDCGNTSVRTLTFHFQDTTEPTFDTMLSNMTVECDMVPAAAVVTASDNCDDNVAVTMEESVTEGCPYSITRVYTAVDNCGNTATMTQVINVIDTIDPVLEGVPANVTIECSDDLPMANVTATDNCTEILEVEMTSETNTFECGSEVIRTWTVSDACGNTATATQVITIVDTTAPYLTSEEEEVIQVECDQVIPAFNPTFGDACDMNLDITSTSEEVNINSCGYDVVRSVTATDNCGNAITVTQTVQVRDTQAPVITGIIDIEAECDADVATLVTVEDNCDETPELTYVDFLVSGGSCQGRIIRIYTATDDCGNTSTFDQIIWLLDSTTPTVEEEPADVVIECGDAIPSFEAIFSDNCDDELNITFNESTVPAECGYSIYRVWTATDNCQNTLVVDQLITITDLTNPVLYNVPADVTIECGNDIPSISTDVYATDNCVEDVNILVTEETVDLACGYQIVRMYRAYDDCGNFAMATQTITIVDTTVPVLSGSAPSVSVLCGDIPSVPVITAFDTCDGVIPVQFSEVTSTGCPYTITRTWTAIDACGNEASMTQVITVTDEVAPQFVNNPVWIQIECSELSGYTLEATDNCDNDVEVSIIEELVFSGGCFGNIQRTYEAVDNCGNSVIFVQIIQLVDTQAPVIENVPVETTIYCDAEIPAVPTNIFGTDNCDTDVEIFFTQTQTNEFCPYDIIRTWTALDECGNETVETQVIHVTVEIPQLISVQTYPNPTDGDFTFEFSTPKDAIVYGAVYDMTGREVLPLMNGKADGGRLYKFVVNGQKMNAGTYTVMMKVDGEVLRNRVVITGK